MLLESGEADLRRQMREEGGKLDDGQTVKDGPFFRLDGNRHTAMMVYHRAGDAGLTALTMPVLAPLGDFAGIDRSLVVATWTAAGSGCD